MDRTEGHFLVERFVPAARHGDIAAAVGRLAEADDGVAEHLLTVLVEEEETCLSLFRASAALVVASANARAGFPFHRIVEVRLIDGGPAVAIPATSRISRAAATGRPPAGGGAR